MKLRKDQRYTLYCILLEEYENGYFYGFCLWWFFEFQEVVWRDKKLKKMLPELWRHRTTNVVDECDGWFNDNSERIKALKKCIKETENF